MAIFEAKDCLSPIKDKGTIVIQKGVFFETPYTFCIPTYKRSRDLKEALDSVFAQQTNLLFNVIVSDNNPERDDETEVLIKTYYSEKRNLRYIKNAENLGMAGNWNRLILECRTDYLILFHDDDVLFPYYLERIDKVRQRYPDLSALNCGKIEGPNTIFKDKNSKEGKVLIHTAKTNYFKFLFGAPSGCLFKVDDLKHIGGFDNGAYPSIDYVCIEKLCLEKKMVLVITEELMFYRIGENATAKVETQKKWLDVDFQIKKELKDLLDISTLKFKMALWFEIKMRLRRLRKSKINSTYLHYKPGDRLFCALYMLYDYCLRRRTKVVK